MYAGVLPEAKSAGTERARAESQGPRAARASDANCLNSRTTRGMMMKPRDLATQKEPHGGASTMGYSQTESFN